MFHHIRTFGPLPQVLANFGPERLMVHVQDPALAWPLARLQGQVSLDLQPGCTDPPGFSPSFGSFWADVGLTLDLEPVCHQKSYLGCSHSSTSIRWQFIGEEFIPSRVKSTRDELFRPKAHKPRTRCSQTQLIKERWIIGTTCPPALLCGL